MISSAALQTPTQKTPQKRGCRIIDDIILTELEGFSKVQEIHQGGKGRNSEELGFECCAADSSVSDRFIPNVGRLLDLICGFYECCAADSKFFCQAWRSPLQPQTSANVRRSSGNRRSNLSKLEKFCAG